MRFRLAVSVLFIASAAVLLTGNLDTVKAQLDCGYWPQIDGSCGSAAPGNVFHGQCYLNYQLQYSCCSSPSWKYINHNANQFSGEIRCTYQDSHGNVKVTDAYPCCGIYY